MVEIRVRSKVKDHAVADMRIGELAKQSGLAPTALRYYEKAGMLPAPHRTQSGYRAYDANVLPRLAFIRAAQAVGLSLSEIREVIAIRDGGSAPCQHVVDLIDRHRAEVMTRIRDLQRMERELTQLAKQGALVDPADCDAAGICKVIPTKAVAKTPSAVSPTLMPIANSPRRRTPRKERARRPTDQP